MMEVRVVRKVVGKNINMEAPGQLLKHYAPYLPCYIYSEDVPNITQNSQPIFKPINDSEKNSLQLSETAFISFSKQNFEQFFKSKCKYYFETGSTIEAE